MYKEVLLYLLLALIFYDLSIHVVYFFKKEKFFLKRGINYWPEWEGRKYQTFWCLFWSTAFLLLFSYLFLFNP